MKHEDVIIPLETIGVFRLGSYTPIDAKEKKVKEVVVPKTFLAPVDNSNTEPPIAYTLADLKKAREEVMERIDDLIAKEWSNSRNNPEYDRGLEKAHRIITSLQEHNNGKSV